MRNNSGFWKLAWRCKLPALGTPLVRLSAHQGAPSDLALFSEFSLSNSYLNLASSASIATPKHVHKVCSHITKSAQVKPAQNKSGMCCLGKLEASSPGEEKPHRGYYYKQCYFFIVLLPKTATFWLQGRVQTEPKGRVPSQTNGRGQMRERSSWDGSERTPAHQELIPVKGYTGIIPPAWRQMQFSRECESCQVCTT